MQPDRILPRIYSARNAIVIAAGFASFVFFGNSLTARKEGTSESTFASTSEGTILRDTSAVNGKPYIPRDHLVQRSSFPAYNASQVEQHIFQMQMLWDTKLHPVSTQRDV